MCHALVEVVLVDVVLVVDVVVVAVHKCDEEDLDLTQR